MIGSHLAKCAALPQRRCELAVKGLRLADCQNCNRIDGKSRPALSPELMTIAVRVWHLHFHSVALPKGGCIRVKLKLALERKRECAGPG
jgi:hypothetical protein